MMRKQTKKKTIITFFKQNEESVTWSTVTEYVTYYKG